MTRHAVRAHACAKNVSAKTFKVTAMSKALVGGLLAAAALAAPTFAQLGWDTESVRRYEACVAKTQTDADGAFEDGLIFRNDGGGALARHCIALALLELGHLEEAASRLEETAFMPDGGDAALRAEMLSQAGNAWLLAHAPIEAENAFTNALAVKPGDPDIFIDRARARAVQARFADAVSDLTVALSLRPNDLLALRLRGAAHLELGQLDQAEQDVNSALVIEPRDIDTLVVRGHIREAKRLAGG